MTRQLPLKYVLPEKKRITRMSAAGMGFDASVIESLGKVLLVVIMLIGICCFVGNTTESILHMKHKIALVLMLMTGLSSFTIGAYYNIIKSNRDNQLKIIQCSSNGIRFGSGKFDIDKTYFVSWNHVQIVEAVEDDLSKSDQYLVIGTMQKEYYELKWENAFAWIDEESFFSIVKSSASHAKLNFAVEEISKKDNLDSRYTNLWLHYFSAPTNRQRKGKLDVGTSLQEGEYQIVEQLSGGGQGMTYVANSSKNFDIYDGSNQVVLKEYVLPVYRGNDLENKKYEKLSKEANILSQLRHEQVVKIFDCFVEDHRGYLVLEYIKGESLNTLVKEKGPFGDLDTAQIGLSITRILSYLHGQEKPIVHRDLTPDNLILNESGVIKLIDFTVAQESLGQRTATIVGKQAYMPPEQFRGQPTTQSDIYAIGCTMYYLLTGEDPKPMEIESPRILKPEIDPGLESIILTASAFDQSHRYQTAEAMAEDLNAWLALRAGVSG